MIRHPVADRDNEKLSAIFRRARKLEQRFGAKLRRIAQHIADVVNAYDPTEPESMARMQDALARYSSALDPWARAAAARMITEVAARDKAAWFRVSIQIGQELKQEIASAPTGAAMRQLLAEQVELIKSLPIEAGERVHKLTLEGLASGARASEIAEKIAQTGQVAKSRATLIARTEVARTATTLTQVRAQSVGSNGYIWTTAQDSDVRSSHKAMNGKFVAWDAPPTLDGMTGHAGCLPNCRCVAIPVIPED